MLLSLAYLPSTAWCSAFWNAQEVVIEACEHYQKGSLRNRAYIAGPNGVQRISIPLLKGKHQQTPIRDVRIAYHEPWQRLHWRTIKTAYGNAPYFEHYADDLRQFYETQYEFLFDFNLELLALVLVKKMGWTGKIILSDTFESSPFATLVEDTNNPAHHPLLPAPTGAGAYPQIFQEKHGFLPNLSVLDLLLCCGKHSGEILHHSAQKSA